jgi:hypothetical protein
MVFGRRFTQVRQGLATPDDFSQDVGIHGEARKKGAAFEGFGTNADR